jgi:hypothetical protein
VSEQAMVMVVVWLCGGGLEVALSRMDQPSLMAAPQNYVWLAVAVHSFLF